MSTSGDKRNPANRSRDRFQGYAMGPDGMPGVSLASLEGGVAREMTVSLATEGGPRSEAEVVTTSRRKRSRGTRVASTDLGSLRIELTWTPLQ